MPGQEENQKKFFAACSEGNLVTVKQLAGEVDVNWRSPDNFGFTGLIVACREGREEVVRFLLDHPKIEVNKADEFGCTHLHQACGYGREAIVKILLRDERVEVNKADNNGWTPLWIACYYGFERVVKILFASGREIDPTKRGKMMVEQSIPLPKLQRKKGMIKSRSWLRKFMKNPQELRERLKKELKWPIYSGEIFVLGAMLCDGYLKIHEQEESSPVGRFFKIFARLHLDVQMILINRSQRLKEDYIRRADQNFALKHLLKSFS